MAALSEKEACTPHPLAVESFNPKCELPYGLTTEHVRAAMEDFLQFLGFVNVQLFSKDIPRLESFLMPANFSSLVGEFLIMTIPKYCSGLVKNHYHNGHPDLIPPGQFPQDAVQYASMGIEVKASRRTGGWQGHNPEHIWLVVFNFESNSANDGIRGIGPKRFRFRGVYAGYLELEDWSFSGRSETSRRTITASVTQSGVQKMKANWVYQD